MTEQHKKNRTTLIIIFAMSIIPFSIAWYMAKNPQWMQKGTNYGELITPPVTVDYRSITGYDAFSNENMKELKGHWVLVNVIPQAQCQAVCVETVHNTRQLHLAMNKDVTRIRRLVLMFDNLPAALVDEFAKEDSRLLRAKADAGLAAQLKALNQGAVQDGMLFLMDPLGNIMMKYPQGFELKQVKSDLGKLLRISQIG